MRDYVYKEHHIKFICVFIWTATCRGVFWCYIIIPAEPCEGRSLTFNSIRRVIIYYWIRKEQIRVINIIVLTAPWCHKSSTKCETFEICITHLITKYSDAVFDLNIQLEKWRQSRRKSKNWPTHFFHWSAKFVNADTFEGSGNSEGNLITAKVFVYSGHP